MLLIKPSSRETTRIIHNLRIVSLNHSEDNDRPTLDVAEIVLVQEEVEEIQEEVSVTHTAEIHSASTVEISTMFMQTAEIASEMNVRKNQTTTSQTLPHLINPSTAHQLTNKKRRLHKKGTLTSATSPIRRK